ncbi:MAG: hypothetical protein ACK5RO_01270 [Pseudobdellovibrionaceae bacterium]
MKKQSFLKVLGSSVAVLASATMITACGGGGGGGGYTGGGSSPVINYPYETVFGDACRTSEPTPGCTFNRNGSRVNVTQDPHYDRYGYDADDLWFVKFDNSGNARVYNDLGQYQYSRHISQFAGFVGGTTIGVGTTGLFWENVSGGTYWLGRNGVLYSANTGRGNFGDAINNDEADEVSDSSFAALNSDANKALVKAASQKLQKDYGFSAEKAKAVASALNVWAVSGAERGYTTTKDMDKTFKSVFGVDYQSALAAVKDLAAGDNSSMRELTDRSAQSLGLKPAQAQKFIKGMYKKALAQWGYDADSISW